MSINTNNACTTGNKKNTEDLDINTLELVDTKLHQLHDHKCILKHGFEKKQVAS